LWEIWALANILIILILVIESIWFPNLNERVSRTLVAMYIGNLPVCDHKAHTLP
jgi:hypothetical protein